jgi:predicted MFS family arabinose efflux permease
VVTELLPIALIGAVASDLHVSEGTAGLMVALPAIVAAVVALAMTVLAGRMDRRYLLIGFSALLLASDLISFAASSFTVMLLARILLGVAIGGFWAIAASLAARLVHERFVGHATALVLGGISIGSVIAVPAGTFIEAAVGWREVFLVASVLAAVVLVAQLLFVPRLPVITVMTLAALPRLLARRPVQVLLGASLLIWTGQLAGYTFISSFLRDLKFDPLLIGGLLLAYGIGGIIGNFVGGAQAARRTRPTILVIVGLLTASMFASLLMPAEPWAAMVVLTVWGTAFGAVPAAMQTWMFSAAAEAPEAGSAMLIAVLQTAIAVGAAVGGIWVNGSGPGAAILFGAGFVAVGFILITLLGRHRNASPSNGPAAA